MYYKDKNTGCLYDGEMRLGDTIASAEDIAGAAAAKLPTRAQRAAALFAPYGITRVTAQMAIGMGELEARLRAATDTDPAISYEDALAETYARNKTYRTCRLLENQALVIDAEAGP